MDSISTTSDEGQLKRTEFHASATVVPYAPTLPRNLAFSDCANFSHEHTLTMMSQLGAPHSVLAKIESDSSISGAVLLNVASPYATPTDFARLHLDSNADEAKEFVRSLKGRLGLRQRVAVTATTICDGTASFSMRRGRRMSHTFKNSIGAITTPHQWPVNLVGGIVLRCVGAAACVSFWVWVCYGLFSTYDITTGPSPQVILTTSPVFFVLHYVCVSVITIALLATGVSAALFLLPFRDTHHARAPVPQLFWKGAVPLLSGWFCWHPLWYIS